MMANQPLVSIVLPTRDRAALLSRAVKTCLQQTYKNFELIIVNDGSSDNTAQVCFSLMQSDKRIRLVSIDASSLPKALNSGFACAQGQYFTWTSDDNYYLPEAIEEMVSVLESDTAIDLVYTDYQIGNLDDSHALLQDVRVEPPATLERWNCIGACFLYRAVCAKQIGKYNPYLFLAEDYDYWLRFYDQFHLYPLHKTLYQYNQHGNSLYSRKIVAIIIMDCFVRSLHGYLPTDQVMIEVWKLYQKHHGKQEKPTWFNLLEKAFPQILMLYKKNGFKPSILLVVLRHIIAASLPKER